MKAVLDAFDDFLQERKLRFETTVVGGAALILQGVVTRATQDVDCLIAILPLDVANAAREFAKRHPGLAEDWLNNGPASLAGELPQGWESRRVPLYRGKALGLHSLGRIDLLRAKIYALLDRQKDLEDCLAIRPRPEELKECYPWLKERDLNPLWPEHVRKTLIFLGKRLGYDLVL